jgi:hypothetical protein
MLLELQIDIKLLDPLEISPDVYDIIVTEVPLVDCEPNERE